MPGVGRNSYKAAMKKAKAKTNKKKTPLKMGHAKKRGTGINNNKPLTAAQKARIKKQKEQMAKRKKEGKPGTGVLNSGPRRLKPKRKYQNR
jgi:hypothetical protein|tara:strand:+ start:117 stop:389 length:273 start_codon:yes stop_codon:yes gene_type:complete